jgi:heme-degrading monooxygenase HmoA
MPIPGLISINVRPDRGAWYDVCNPEPGISEKEALMFSVIFEVLPNEGRKDEYLELAGNLKPILEAIDGFVDVERYESKRRPGWVLSQSTWRDEKSMVRWRTQRDHYFVQSKGRFEIFADYHLRIGEITSDTDPPKGLNVVEQRFDETEVGAAKLVTFTEATPAKNNTFARPDRLPAHLGLDLSSDGVADHDVFESIYNPGKLVLLTSWKDTERGRAWSPASIPGFDKLRHRRMRIVRDYGRFDRREAPQYYADIKQSSKGAR